MPVQPHLIDATQTLIHEDDLSQEQARSWLQHLNNDRARRGGPTSERLLERTREWLRHHPARRAGRR